MGVLDAEVSEHGVLMATVPATTGRAGVPTIGFIAHVDTSPEMPGDNVETVVHTQYDGRNLVLPDDPTLVLRLADNPSLPACIGEDIVTASGLTLLGADDKAGVAEIMAAAEYLIAHPEIRHGAVRIAFTPDEEIGRGTAHFDVARFGARLRLHAGRGQPRRARDREFLRRLDDLHVPGIQHPSRIRETTDGQCDQGRRRFPHPASAGRSARDDRRGTRGSRIPTSWMPAWTAHQ